MVRRCDANILCQADHIIIQTYYILLSFHISFIFYSSSLDNDGFVYSDEEIFDENVDRRRVWNESPACG